MQGVQVSSAKISSTNTGSGVLKQRTAPLTFRGTIGYYDTNESYGCIVYENKNNKNDLILFFQQGLAGEYKTKYPFVVPKENDNVTFNIVNTNQRGPVAFNVKPLL
jgi:cold shock CspA family protein